MGGSGGGGGDQGSMLSGIMAMQAAQKQYELGMEQLKWSKEVYNEFKPYIMDSTKQSLADQKFQSEMSHQQWDTYNQTYLPIEKQFAEDAQNWDTQDRRNRMAGMAEANIASQFEQARNAAETQLEGFGVDPTSLRYAALDIGTRTQQAAAAAGAGTGAMQNVENQGLALKGQAINTGRGYQNNINQTTGVGTGAGSAGVGGLTNFYGTSSNAMTAPVAWFNAGNQAMSNQITAFNNYTNNGIKQQQANQQGMQGMMSGISGLLGSVMSLEDGGAIPTPDRIRAAEVQPQEGGAVPYHASPSNGQEVDDVPARLSPGEFVLPKEFVEWRGLENIYKDVDKAKKARADYEATTETRPDISMGIPEAPNFVSRS